jgi:hypothetical protein
VPTISHRTTFRNDNAFGDPAHESNTASEQNPGPKPGVINPSDNRTKESNSLLQYISCLKIQRESKEHNPASTREWGVSQINPPIMLHHPQLPAISKLMWSQVDHGLLSNGREKLRKTKTQRRRTARTEMHTMLILKIL